MKNTLKIAVVQFSVAHLKPEINLKRAESFIKQSSQNNANVIVFPEDFMTGSIFGDRRYLDRNHHFLNQFQKLAKKYSIDIVCGSWMEDTPRGAFSTTNYVDSTGKVLGTYHKNHLYLSEKKFLTPETKISVFDTKYGKAGLIICWDIMFPEIFQRMKALDVQIVYCPSYWYKEIAGARLKRNPDAEENRVDKLCLARAKENNIILVYANASDVIQYSDGAKDTLIGHSQIAAPNLGVVAKLAHNHEKMIIQKLSTKKYSTK